MSILLEIRHASAGYYKEDVVKDISLKVNQRDLLGIIGPNGSGKTTLLRMATRVIYPRQGEVYFMGEDIAHMGLKELSRRIAFVSQDVSTDFSFTVMEVVLMGRIPHLRRLEFETRKDLEVAEKALSETGSLSLKDKRIDELSAGERQRVIISRALAQEPILLFLDEPTAHLDIGHQVQIMDLLSRLNRNAGLTIVMVMHDLNLASTYCNRIVLLDRGRVFKEGSPDEVLTYQNIEAVYQTIVLVHKNPVTGKPNVILVPKGR